MKPRGPDAPDLLPAPTSRSATRIASGARRPNPAGGTVADPYGEHPARSPGWVVFVGFGGFVFTIGAVVLETVSGSYANSALPGWAKWVPPAWPQPLRVIWWLVVATSAGAFRWSSNWVGLQPNRVVTALTVMPFVAFAMGIAIGADWATWH